MYYLVTYKLAEDYIEARAPFRAAHFEHIKTSIGKGEFIMGGAFEDQVEASLVFKVASVDAVKLFIKNDPYVIKGVVTEWSIRLWNVAITSF